MTEALARSTSELFIVVSKDKETGQLKSDKFGNVIDNWRK